MQVPRVVPQKAVFRKARSGLVLAKSRLFLFNLFNREGIMSNEKFSIADLAKQILEGQLDPKTLDRAVIKKIAVHLKDLAYSSEEIAHHLKVDKRTIQRYIRDHKKSFALELEDGFQKNFLGEFLNDVRLHRQYLWRLIHSGDLSGSDKLKAICALNQVAMNAVGVLERLGYLTEARAKQELLEGTEASIERRDQEEVSRMTWICDSRLRPDQHDFLKRFYIGEKHSYPHKQKEIVEKLRRFIEEIAEENAEEFKKKQEEAAKRVTSSTRIPCKVFFVSRLCNN